MMEPIKANIVQLERANNRLLHTTVKEDIKAQGDIDALVKSIHSMLENTRSEIRSFGNTGNCQK
jgi:hypothetical protein